MKQSDQGWKNFWMNGLSLEYDQDAEVVSLWVAETMAGINFNLPMMRLRSGRKIIQ